MENSSKKNIKQICLDFLINELIRNGYEPSLKPKIGNKSREIEIKRKSDNKIITIQLRTKRDSNPAWVLNEKEEKLSSPIYFYTFVNLDENTGNPLFYIVPSGVIAKYCKNDHEEWFNKPGKNGQQHNNSTVRKFYDPEGSYLNAWNLLEA